MHWNLFPSLNNVSGIGCINSRVPICFVVNSLQLTNTAHDAFV